MISILLIYLKPNYGINFNLSYSNKFSNRAMLIWIIEEYGSKWPTKVEYEGKKLDLYQFGDDLIEFFSLRQLFLPTDWSKSGL